MSDMLTTPMTGLWRLLPQLKGAHMQGEAAADVLRVHTDTRTLQAGDLFVALQGERFDAHAFLPQAAQAGAVAALASYGLADCGLQHTGHHLCDGGFAVAAGHGNHR